MTRNCSRLSTLVTRPPASITIFAQSNISWTQNDSASNPVKSDARLQEHQTTIPISDVTLPVSVTVKLVGVAKRRYVPSIQHTSNICRQPSITEALMHFISAYNAKVVNVVLKSPGKMAKIQILHGTTATNANKFVHNTGIRAFTNTRCILDSNSTKLFINRGFDCI